MAQTAAGRRLTEAHRLAQARLSALVADRVRPLWRLIDLEDVAATAPAWIDAIARLVSAQHDVSAELSRRYYRAFRTQEVGSPPTGELDRLALNRDALTTSLFVTGPVRIERARRRSEDVEIASKVAAASSSRAAARHALEGGRRTLVSATAGDRRALGFARATSGSPCHFCAMLAGRGPVYRSDRSASFDAHDGCACTPEPVFSRDAPWPPGARRYAEIYDEAARGESDPLTAFRRAYEGRAEN